MYIIAIVTRPVLISQCWWRHRARCQAASRVSGSSTREHSLMLPLHSSSRSCPRNYKRGWGCCFGRTVNLLTEAQSKVHSSATEIVLFQTQFLGQSMEALYKRIPMSMLPQEYLPDDYTGPNAGTFDQLRGGQFCFVKQSLTAYTNENQSWNQNSWNCREFLGWDQLWREPGVPAGGERPSLGHRQDTETARSKRVLPQTQHRLTSS